jgi:hypothetical protein
MFKNRQRGRSPLLRDGSGFPTPGTGIGLDTQLLTPQKITLKLDGAELAVDADDDYGSLLLMTWQDRNLHILGLESDLTLVKGGVTNGITAAKDLDVGMGSAPASNTTLATTMIDYMEKQDLDDNALSVDLNVHVLGQTTATFPKQLADASDNKLYLNAAVVGGITASDTLTVSGYVDIYFIDLGNRTS